MLLERNENLRDKNIIYGKKSMKEIKCNNLQKENKIDCPKKQLSTTKINKNNNTQTFVITETEKIRYGNLKKVLSHELSKLQANFRENFLLKHSITEEIRTRMVDWMIEVLSSFSCS